MAITLFGPTSGGHAASHQVGAVDQINVADYHRSGLASARPAASASLAGVYYFATDNLNLYRCDGSTWLAVSAGGGFAWPGLGYTQPLPGRYLAPPAIASGVKSGIGNGTTMSMPYVVPVKCTFDRFNFKTNTASEAGGVGRCVIWKFDPIKGYPNDLVADLGTTAIDGAAGTKELTIAIDLDPGIYGLGVVQQNCPTTRSNMIQITQLNVPFFFGIANGSRSADAATNLVGWLNNAFSNTSGAFTQSFDRNGTDVSAVVEQNSVPVCKLRVAV